MKTSLILSCNEKGAFNSDIEFQITASVCHICKKHTTVLCAGAGANEYGFARICMNCITDAMAHFTKSKKQ